MPQGCRIKKKKKKKMKGFQKTYIKFCLNPFTLFFIPIPRHKEGNYKVRRNEPASAAEEFEEQLGRSVRKDLTLDSLRQ